MYTGSLPFVSENVEQLKNFIVNKEFPNPKGNKLSTKPSPEFISLLKGLLQKDPSKRLKWRQIVNHPFWEKQIEHLMPSVSASRKSIFIDGKEEIIDEPEADDLDEVDDQVNNMNLSRILTDRPKTASGSMILEKHPEINVSFSISSRLPCSPQSTMQTRTAVQCQESDLANTLIAQQTDEIMNEKCSSKSEYRRMFFLPSELNVSPIVDNPKIQKITSLKFEPKALPFSNQKLLKTSSFLSLAKSDYEKGLDQIKANTNVPSDKSASAIKLKLHLMNYIGTLCMESSRLADSFIQVGLYKELLHIVKNGHSLEMKMKASRIMALIFNKAKNLDTSIELTETLQGLVDIISANRKDIKFKQVLLPALGELLYFISCQECLIGKSSDTWQVPSLAYVLMIRTIGEDLTLNHMICKIIENIASTNSNSVQKFLTNQVEVVNALWTCFSHSANNEQIRVASLKALSLLATHSINVIVTLIDKIGADTFLECLSSNSSQIQQIILTLIAMVINDGSNKSLPDKKVISMLTNLYDSANVVCRAKAYLLTYTMIKEQNDTLIQFTQSKLINSLERDTRKNLPNREENDFMHKMIDMLLDLITTIAMDGFNELLSVLDAVYGRKNPSQAQVKMLKKIVPVVSIFKGLVTSQMYRGKLFDADFMEKLGKLISLSKPIGNGEFNLNTICGPGASSEYTNSLTGIVETIIQHKEILQTFSLSIMQFILPALIENITSSNSELRISSIKFLAELCALFFSTHEQTVNDDIKKQLRKFIELNFIELIDELLGQSEPVPYFTLSVMQSTLSHDITLISILKVKNILPPVFKLFQDYKSKPGSPIVLKLLNVISLWSSTLDPLDLYDFNIVEYLKGFLLDISRMNEKYEESHINQMLIELLKISDNLLKYVSEFVKKALQAKKASGGSGSDTVLAQKAEKLLHSNKSLAGCGQFLLTLLLNEDSDINEMACKILWVLMQLFGSECKELLNEENINIILNCILNSNSKKQKILLRISKRLITADKQNLEHFKSIGGDFIENLNALRNTANAEANVSLSSMIDEVLKLV